MRRFERAAAVMCLGVLAFGALALVTGAGTGRAESKSATVDTFGLLQEMLTTTEYAEPREAMRTAAVAELEALQGEIQRMDQELRLIPQTDQARGQALYQRLQQANQQYQQLSQQKQMEFMQISGTQAADAYAKIHAAANAVAEREGYTQVFSSRAGSEIDDINSLNSVTQGILSRPMLRFPAEDDLTDKVRAEIGYTLPEAPAEPAEGGEGGEEVEPSGDGG